MGENIFILGAGASKESGAPLMNNFLDVAEDLLRENSFDSDSVDKIKEVFKIITYLQGVHAKSYLDLNNIESLFGAVEMARVINRLGEYSPQKIFEIREALITLIVKTIEKKISFPVKDKVMCPTNSYKEFVDLIRDKTLGTSSIITFNYDIALDFALIRCGANINYCLDSGASNGVKLLKLHGSVNWGKCKKCGNIVPFSLDKFIRKFYSKFGGDMRFVSLAISPYLKHLKDYHEHDEFENIPVIVPPTWNKTEYHGSLTNVWSQAAKEFSLARNIYVFGYSLPESDLFFRYLFALGTMGETRIRRFWVFDPEDSGVTEARYKRLLGQGINSRFEYVSLPFVQGIMELRKRIKL